MNFEQRSTFARICICVDDFGMSDGVNEAVFQLASRERVHATSCMVFAPAWLAGSGALRRLDRQKLDVGLHLDFTQFPSCPSRRQSLKTMVFKSTLGLLDSADIRSEIRVQLDAFERTMGRPPSYIDGHQHVHQLHGVRDELLDEIKQRYPAASMPWIRVSRGLPLLAAADRTGWRNAAKSYVISSLGSAPLTKLLQTAHIRSNHRLLGLYGFSGNKDSYDQLLGSWLFMAADSDLLMCHPSMKMAQEDDPIAAARLAEFASLHGDSFASMLSTTGVRLMPMSLILQART